jgi:hypothetical protein
MKFDEMNDMCSILIEPGDSREDILQLLAQQRKAVVLVVPERAAHVFQHGMHFAELRQLKRQRGISLTLVLMGNEQARQNARRHGFVVYASQEICARAIGRRERLYGPLSAQVSRNARVEAAMVEAFKDPDELIQTIKDPDSDCNTDYEPTLPLQAVQVSRAAIASRPSRIPLQYAQMDTAWYGETVTHILPATEPLTQSHRRRGVDVAMLILLALIALGMLGGVGFGYLLSAIL